VFEFPVEEVAKVFMADTAHYAWGQNNHHSANEKSPPILHPCQVKILNVREEEEARKENQKWVIYLAFCNGHHWSGDKENPFPLTPGKQILSHAFDSIISIDLFTSKWTPFSTACSSPAFRINWFFHCPILSSIAIQFSILGL
jgi:hypothetical protein